MLFRSERLAIAARWMLGACLAACGTVSCASKPRTNAEAVQALGLQVTRMRDAAPHVGPAFADLPPEDRAAAIDAPDEESFRRAMVALVDDMQDGHAFVAPLADSGPYMLAFPAGVAVVVPTDRQLWLGLTDDAEPSLSAVPGCRVDGSGKPLHGVREWILVEAVDGHTVHTAMGASQLMLGTPDSTVIVDGTDTLGRSRRLEMRRTVCDRTDLLDPASLVAMGDMATLNLQFGDALPPESFDAARLRSKPEIGRAHV